MNTVKLWQLHGITAQQCAFKDKGYRLMSEKYTKNSLIRKTHLNTSMTFCPTIISIESLFLQRNSLTLMGYEGSCTVMLVTMNPQAKEDIHVRIRVPSILTLPTVIKLIAYLTIFEGEGMWSFWRNFFRTSTRSSAIWSSVRDSMYRASFPLSQPATYKEDSLSNYSLRSSDLEAVTKRTHYQPIIKRTHLKQFLRRLLTKSTH